MKKREFELILENSLTRLEAGVSLQEILKENPRYSEKLEPLLQAALTAWSLPEPEYQKAIREGRNRLQVEVERMKKAGAFSKNGTKSKNTRLLGQWFKNIGSLLVGKENTEMKFLPRLAIYGVMTVLIGGFFTVNASASSLPGDGLYGLKRGWEQARLTLSFNDDIRQELEGEFEDERLDEVESLLGEGREEDVEFRGLIESKSDGTWVVSGISVAVDAQTELKGALEVGDLVKVEALTQANGSLLALEILGEGAGMDDDLIDDADDDLNDDAEDDMDDDADDDMDDDDMDDMDDDDMDDMDDDSGDDMDDDSDNGSSSKDDDSSDASRDEVEEKDKEDKEESDD